MSHFWDTGGNWKRLDISGTFVCWSVSWRSLCYRTTFLNSFIKITASLFTCWCKSTSALHQNSPSCEFINISRVTQGGQFGQRKPLGGSQKSELRAGVGEVFTSDTHTYKHQMQSALKQVRRSSAGSETSPHKYLWILQHWPVSLSIHDWHLLWGWAIQNRFKDLKQ